MSKRGRAREERAREEDKKAREIRERGIRYGEWADRIDGLLPRDKARWQLILSEMVDAGEFFRAECFAYEMEENGEFAGSLPHYNFTATRHLIELLDRAGHIDVADDVNFRRSQTVLFNEDDHSGFSKLRFQTFPGNARPTETLISRLIMRGDWVKVKQLMELPNMVTTNPEESFEHVANLVVRNAGGNRFSFESRLKMAEIVFDRFPEGLMGLADGWFPSKNGKWTNGANVTDEQSLQAIEFEVQRGPKPDRAVELANRLADLKRFEQARQVLIDFSVKHEPANWSKVAILWVAEACAEGVSPEQRQGGLREADACFKVAASANPIAEVKGESSRFGNTTSGLWASFRLRRNDVSAAEQILRRLAESDSTVYGHTAFLAELQFANERASSDLSKGPDHLRGAIAPLAERAKYLMASDFEDRRNDAVGMFTDLLALDGMQRNAKTFNVDSLERILERWPKVGPLGAKIIEEAAKTTGVTADLARAAELYEIHSAQQPEYLADLARVRAVMGDREGFDSVVSRARQLGSEAPREVQSLAL